MTHKPTSKQLSADGYIWTQHSPRVGIITNDMHYFSRVAYFAFDSWHEAHGFFRGITDKKLCSRAQVRESQRFLSHAWEVKVWAMPDKVLARLIERDRSRQAVPFPPISREWESVRSFDAIRVEAA